MTTIIPALSPLQSRAYDVVARRLRNFPQLEVQLGLLLQERMVNALMDLEVEFGVPIDVDEAYACRTIGRLIALVEAKASPRLGWPGADVKVVDLVAHRAAIGKPIAAERFAAAAFV
jgi:hypothetical protein